MKMRSEVYARGLFTYEKSEFAEDIYMHTYYDCVLLQDISYVQQNIRVWSDFDDAFEILPKGTKWKQITYSVGECVFYLDHLEEGIRGVFSMEEWLKANVPQ